MKFETEYDIGNTVFLVYDGAIQKKKNFRDQDFF